MTYSVDTNVIIRYLTGDDPEQALVAKDVLQAGFMFSASVAMETEWVLRSVYRWPRAQIVEALHDLIDLPSLIAIPDGLSWAIEWYAGGADLADMVHLIGTSGADAFATFDALIGKLIGNTGPLPIETLR